MPDAKWYANWVRMLPAESAPEKMRNLEAADLIESLVAELEQVKRERDAAVEDLRGACAFCAHVRECLVTGCTGDMGEACKQCPCETCFHDSNWQWRGVKED